MPLSNRLFNVNLTLHCRYCGLPITKPGRWFMTVSHFNCQGCGREAHVTYEEKVALFEKNANLPQSSKRNVLDDRAR